MFSHYTVVLLFPQSPLAFNVFIVCHGECEALTQFLLPLLPPVLSLLLSPFLLSLLLSLPPCLQCPEWWQCRLRCGWWRTTLRLCRWWRSTSSAAPRRASSTTTPSPDTTIAWPRCRPEARRPATRYAEPWTVFFSEMLHFSSHPVLILLLL